MAPTSCEARVTELEIRLTYQNDLLATLDRVVVELRRELEATQKRLARLERELAEGPPDEAANDPPPHY